METYRLFVDGRFEDGESRETRPTINPSTEEPIGAIIYSGKPVFEADEVLGVLRKAWAGDHSA